MADNPVFLAGAVRTPIGKFGGALASLSAPELGGPVVAETLRRTGIDPGAVSSLVFGHARQAGAGPNPARQVVRRGGLPDQVPARTVNQACASGLRALVDAAMEVRLGEAEVVVAGGMESMSNTPYLLPKARWGYRLGHDQVVDGMVRDGFLCPLCGKLMGETAETLVERYGISREQQDGYAVESQHRCEAARHDGRFKAEVLALEVEGKKGRALVGEDEHPRDGVTLESLARLEGVFRKGGSVHAGNSSGITDGAAAMVVLSEAAARRHGVEPMARLVAWSEAGVDPAVMGIGPVPAVRRLLGKTGLTLADIDLVELNEAFAAQVIACERDLGIDRSRLNVNGGAIALGHPIGCTGARVITTLVHEMARRGARRGLATLCVSGGMGMAVLLERPETGEGAEMGYEYVLYDVDAHIATITLNRPDKLNALYGSMREEIVDALRRAASDPAVRAAIVTGAGRGFCAGGDVAYMAGLIDQGDETSFHGLVSAGAEVVRTVRECPKPVIAAVNGPAAGGGMNLALACDLRLASSDATFSQAFVKIGMHPDWGGTYLLPRLVGVARALELVLTGRQVRADEALAMGLVSRVVAPAELMAEARALAAALADGPPIALAAAKRSLYDAAEGDLETALAREIEVQLRCFRSRDAREGMQAFREKRRPRFEGV